MLPDFADVHWQSQTIALFSVRISECLTFANHDKFRLTATLDTRRKTRAYLGILNCDRTHLHPTVGAEQHLALLKNSSGMLYKCAAATLCIQYTLRYAVLSARAHTIPDRPAMVPHCSPCSPPSIPSRAISKVRFNTDLISGAGRGGYFRRHHSAKRLS